MSSSKKWKQRAKKAQNELEKLREKYAQCLIKLEKAQELSLHDELTLLPNRRYFNQYLEQQWKTCERGNLSLGLLLCDIDNFKAYNDYFGHPQGDDCLKRVAQTLTTVVQRKQDFVARFGGEEFAVILPNTGLKGVKKLAKNILQSVRNLEIVIPTSETKLSVTVSIGGKVMIPQQSESIELMLKWADSALYVAKSLGKNQSTIYGDTNNDQSAHEGVSFLRPEVLYQKVV